jgi:hypothetical protein
VMHVIPLTQRPDQGSNLQGITARRNNSSQMLHNMAYIKNRMFKNRIYCSN